MIAPIDLCDYLNQNACKRADNIKKCGYANIRFDTAVYAEQNEQADTCARAQARNNRAKTDSAFDIKLGKYYRGRAVRNKTDKRGEQRLENAVREH